MEQSRRAGGVTGKTLGENEKIGYLRSEFYLIMDVKKNYRTYNKH